MSATRVSPIKQRNLILDIYGETVSGAVVDAVVEAS
jgi:hypothetical protein